MSNNSEVLFSFGVISDIQYADIDDGMNFSKTETRWYRTAVYEAQKAVEYWKTLGTQLSFVAQLGDLIDGQNSGAYGEGLSFAEPQSHIAFEKVMSPLRSLDVPVLHVVGNHELYNFAWNDLAGVFNDNEKQHTIGTEPYYFSWKPIDGWRVIVLNSYVVSTMHDKDTPGYQEAYEILAQRNKNFLSQGKVDYFEGLEGLELRFVPFNGGYGAEQIAWFAAELAQAKEAQEKVIVLSHTPMHEQAASSKNLAFDYDEALEIMHSAGVVQVVFAGHYHRGGYAQDEAGIHHVTIQAPLTHGHCFGVVEVRNEGVSVVGHGAQRSFELVFRQE